MLSSAAVLSIGHPDRPKKSSIHIVAPEALDCEPVSAAVRYWNRLRGTRRYPARKELAPREMTAFLRNIVLLRVLDGGDDFEFRIVGDAHVQAQGLNFKGMRLKELESSTPNHERYTRATYEHVRITAEPLALRGWIGRDVPQSTYCYYETAFLPLGTRDAVDHILVVTSYTPPAGGAAIGSPQSATSR
jgi:hypothetical protein